MADMYKFSDGGLRNVWLANGFTVKKTPYGEAVAIEDVPGLTRAICAALTKKPGGLPAPSFVICGYICVRRKKRSANFSGRRNKPSRFGRRRAKSRSWQISIFA